MKHFLARARPAQLLGLQQHRLFRARAALRLAPMPVGEFRAMVNAIHDAGLEVMLDVAYNHTGEGDAIGPTPEPARHR